MDTHKLMQKNKKIVYGIIALFVIVVAVFIWNNYQIEISERPVKPLRPLAIISGECGIEQCHGFDITCGSNIPELCTTEARIDDVCRQYARCEKVDRECRLIKESKFEECRSCVEKCNREEDPGKAFQCANKCGEMVGSGQGTGDDVTSTSVPVHIVVNIDRAPRINETGNIRWVVSSDWDMSQINAFLELPDGVQFVSGTANWQGSLLAKDSKQLLTIIKVIKEGIHEIRGVVRTEPAKSGDSWSDVNYLYLTVTATGSKIGLPSDDDQVGTEKMP